jgi:PAS domain S-box-containing protein
LGSDSLLPKKRTAVATGFAGGDDAILTGPSNHECFYRTLVEGSLDVITVVDESGTILFQSASAEVQLGRDPEETIGHSLFEHVHPDDADRLITAFEEAVRHETTSAPIEHRLRHANGQWRPFESVGRFRCSLEGTRLGIIHSREIGARKALEAQVRQSQRMEAVGLSTGAIAHDFNNLLVVIAGYASLLTNDPSATVREFAREMRSATDRAKELTTQLLAFARPGGLDDLSCETNEVIGDFRPILDRMVGRHVTVNYALDAQASTVPLGRSALEQILINLAVNARDAMPAGGELSVTTTNEWRARGAAGAMGLTEYLVLRVTDTGVGMTDDVKSRIFEPFFTTKAPGRGTGIGLQTVFRLSQQAGGRIDVISAPGRGTTFRVLLPVQRDGAGLDA